VDLVWRLVEAGWDVRYVPASTVRHHGAATLGGFLRRQAFYGSTAAPLGHRHADAVAPARLSTWTAVASLLVLARRPGLAAATMALSVASTARRLSGLVRRPGALAMAGGSTERAALTAIGGLTRAWSPGLLLAVALGSRRTRRLASTALLLPALSDWMRSSRRLDLIRYTGLHVADDTAYGIGVWAGCVRARSIRPLVPRVARPRSVGRRRGA
jgi:hypothetical protein